MHRWNLPRCSSLSQWQLFFFSCWFLSLVWLESSICSCFVSFILSSRYFLVDRVCGRVHFDFAKMLRFIVASTLLSALIWAIPGHANAATKVDGVSKSGAPLFQSETLQLTTESLSHLDQNHSALFDFGQNETDLKPRTWGAWVHCKVFPGDLLWPLPFVWDLFDRLLGGALIKTVPLAASCYSSWSEYDRNECETISEQWSDSHLQYV